MKQIGWMVLLLTGLSACASNGSPAPQRAAMNWDSISGAKVAKVNNIKSLISPGVY